MEADGAANTRAEPGSDPAPLSKRQQKRLAKMESQQANKRAKKAAEKEKKQQASEAKRAAVDEMLQKMTEEERQEWFKQQKEKKQQVHASKKAAKEHQQKALSAPQKIAIDLNFPGLMNASDLKSLCQQLSYSYSAAVNREQQLHLHLLGATEDLEAALHQKLPGHVHWAATQSEKTFKEYFQDRLSDLVYLTADSPNELEALDPSKIYIIGGIVDRNKHKGICFQRAQEAGISTAKLPIRKYVKLQTSVVITVNQVVDILVRVQKDNDWRAALLEVLPGRKIVETQQQDTAAAAAAAATEAADKGPEQQGVAAAAPADVTAAASEAAGAATATVEADASEAAADGSAAAAADAAVAADRGPEQQDNAEQQQQGR